MRGKASEVTTPGRRMELLEPFRSCRRVTTPAIMPLIMAVAHRRACKLAL